MNRINTKLLNNIKNEIIINRGVTQKYIAQKYKVSERTVRRYYGILKLNNVIKRNNNGNKIEWLAKK